MAHMATGNREEALDLVQDAMLGLVQGYASRPVEEWRPLFHRILQNRITDWRRRNMVKSRLLQWVSLRWGDDTEREEDPMLSVPDHKNRDPLDELLATHAREALVEAIRGLPFRQQQTFLLRAWEGLDVKETATALGCSEGSIKSHFSRAIHTLRERMKDHWG